MNRLKYIFRVNVPHRVSSSATQPRCGHHNGACFKRRHSKLRLSKSNKLLSSAKETIRRNYNLTGAQYKEHLCSKYSTATDRQAIQACMQNGSKTLSSCTDPKEQNCHLGNVSESTGLYSPHEPTFSSNVTCEKLWGRKYDNLDEMNELNEWDSRPKICKSVCNLAQKQTEVRTYAQMIADYSELMYVKQSVLPPRMYIVEQNSFDGLRRVSMKDRYAEDSKMPVYSLSSHRESRPPRSRSPGSFGQSVRFNSGGPPNQFDRIDDSDFQVTKVLSNPALCPASADEGKESRSYAKMISDYSAALYMHASSYITNVRMTAENEFSRIHSLDSVWLMAKDNRNPDDPTNPNGAAEASEYSSYMPAGDDHDTEKPKDRKCTTVSKKSASYSDSAPLKDLQKINMVHLLDNIGEQKWLDRTAGSHKLETVMIDPAKPVKHLENVNPLHTDRDLNLMKPYGASSMEAAKEKIASGSAPNMSSLSSQGSQATAQKKPPRVPAAGPVAATRPQVELQMAASTSGAVVSINVDKVKALNAESNELSVVVRSNKADAAAAQPDKPNWRSSSFQKPGMAGAQKTDYGPMRFSITEESAPVKQIEFSINGKPASEVKSITALAEKLDVVSSIDKLEVRVPFAQNKQAAGSHGVVKTYHTTDPVLNIQILAKFDKPRADHLIDTSAKVPSKNEPLPKPPEAPKTQYVFKGPPAAEDKKSKTSANTMPLKDNKGGGRGKSGSGTPAPVGVPGQAPNTNVPKGGFKASAYDLPTDAGQENIVDVKGDSTYTSNQVVPGGGAAKKGEQDEDGSVGFKKEATDPRTPSRMIPWWSSDDCFRNIRKLDNDREVAIDDDRKASPQQQIAHRQNDPPLSSTTELEESGRPTTEIKSVLQDQVNSKVNKVAPFKVERRKPSPRQQAKSATRTPREVRTGSETLQNLGTLKNIKNELKSASDKTESSRKERDQQKQDNIKVEASDEAGKKSQKADAIAKELKPTVNVEKANTSIEDTKQPAASKTSSDIKEPAKKLDQNVILKNEADPKITKLKTAKGDPRVPIKVDPQNVKVEPKKENDAPKVVRSSPIDSGTIQPTDRALMNKTTPSKGTASQQKYPSNQSSTAQKVSAPETKPPSQSKADKETDDSYAKLIRETKYTGKVNQLVSDASEMEKVKKPTQQMPSKQSSVSNNSTPKKVDSMDSKNKNDTLKSKQPSTVKGKNVFDSMRPIEKRKDGTLIDFGVKVSSRKKPEKLKIRVKPIRDTTSFSKKLKEASAEKLKISEKTSKIDVKPRTTSAKQQKETTKLTSPAKSETKVPSQTDPKSPVKDKDEKKGAKTHGVESQSKSGDGVTKPTKHDKDGKPSGTVKFTTFPSRKDSVLARYKNYVSVGQRLKSAPPERLRKSLLDYPVVQHSLKQFSAKSVEPTCNGKSANILKTKKVKTVVSTPLPSPRGLPGSPSHGTIVLRPVKRSTEKVQKSLERSSEISPHEDFVLPSFTPFAGTIISCRPSKFLTASAENPDDFPIPGTITQPRKRWIKARPEIKSANNMEISKQAKTRLLSRIDTEQGAFPANVHGPGSNTGDPQGVPSSLVHSTSVPVENEAQKKPGHEEPSSIHDRTNSRTNLACTDTPSDVFYLNATDRPEKSMLYSVWLQRFKDVNQNV